MTNQEYYKKELQKEEAHFRRGHLISGFCKSFIQPYVLKQERCENVDCKWCQFYFAQWLNQEHRDEDVADEVDWSKVPIDTPVMVSNGYGCWYLGYFAGLNSYQEPCVWTDGQHSTETNLKKAWDYIVLIDKRSGKKIYPEQHIVKNFYKDLRE